MKGLSLLVFAVVLLGCQNGEEPVDQNQGENDTVQKAPEPKTIKEQNEANNDKLDEIMDVKTPQINTKNDSLYQEIMSAQPKNR